MNNFKIHYKVSLWRKMEFTTEASLEEVKQRLIEIQDIEDFDLVEDVDDDILGVLDTEERLTPEDNGNQATIELYDGKEIVWDNTYIWGINGNIVIDEDIYKSLKTAYNNAIGKNLDSFIFYNREVSTSYVKYLLQHLKTKFEEDESTT